LLTDSNTVCLIWPVGDALGQLQSAPDLGAVMTNVPTPPTTVGTNSVVEFPATNERGFFRLNYP
jgi:hypothetical protein